MPIFVGAGTSSFAKGSGGVGFSQITTTQRNALSGVIEGTVIYNSTLNKLEVYDGSNWAEVSPTPLLATGGNSVSTSSRSGYKVHTFTSPGTFAVTTGTADSGEVEVLVVAGGGSGGGGRHSGGGGAGAIRFSNTQTLEPGNYSVTVGSGGATGPYGGLSNDGANSVFGSITAAGGGGGGAPPASAAGRAGGSGGGEAHSSQGAGNGTGAPGGGPNSASPGVGWGNNGGNIAPSALRAGGGGGGGAAAVG